MPLHPRRAALAALAGLALVTIAAACGGGSSSAGSGASVVPGGAVLYGSALTDEQSGQWRQAAGLIRRLPGGDDLIRGFLRELEAQGDWETEVAPALGPELVFVLLSASDQDELVSLTQPDDEDAFKALVEKSDDSPVAREIEGWWAVAESEALLDRYEEALDEGSLEDSAAFRDAIGDLPAARLLTLYVGANAAEGQAPGMLNDEALDCLTGEASGGSALAIGTNEDGFRLSSTSAEIPFDVGTGASDLDDKLPGGALAFASGHDGASLLRRALDCFSSGMGVQLDQLETFTGISVERDVLPLFEGETAIAVYPPGALQRGGKDPIDATPTVALVTQVEDTEDVLASLDRHIRTLGPLGGNLTLREQTVGGLPTRTVSRDGSPVFSYAAADGFLVLSNMESGALVLSGGGPVLARDEAYVAAREAASVPDETAGFLYVDVASIWQLSQTLKGSAPPESDVPGGLVLWGERDGDSLTTQGFLAIE